mmetsp:Transcript_78694/g.218591  ORF Transcript_78694/g.218591 Transcript_78694/m.218591 type:complete len:264 (-) Transcript_78694:1891-2682(-)
MPFVRTLGGARPSRGHAYRLDEPLEGLTDVVDARGPHSTGVQREVREHLHGDELQWDVVGWTVVKQLAELLYHGAYRRETPGAHVVSGQVDERTAHVEHEVPVVVIEQDCEDLVQTNLRHALPCVRVPREVAQGSSRLNQRLDVVRLQEQRAEQATEELLVVFLEQQVRGHIVEEQVRHSRNHVQHELLTLANSLRPEHVQQRVDDSARGRQCRASGRADRHVSDQPDDLHQDLVDLLQSRCFGATLFELDARELALFLPILG